VRYGGYTRGSPSALPGTWYYESDHEGFCTELYGVSFQQVQSFLQQTFGSPLRASTNLDGFPYGLYSVREIGVAIQYFGSTNGVGFICLKKQDR